MLGATKPSDSAPGTIRGDFALDVGRYIIISLNYLSVGIYHTLSTVSHLNP